MQRITTRKRQQQKYFIFGCLLLTIVTILSIMFGRFSFTLADNNIVAFFQQFTNSQAQKIMWQLRLPRVLAAIIIGASLSVTGVAYQSVFQNPLASPGTLGAQNGAAFGAAIALFFSASSFVVTGVSFITGMASVVLVYFVSRYMKGNRTLILILSGTLIGTLFSSGTSFLKLIADTSNTLPAITYWLMGSLADIRMTHLALLAGLNCVGMIILMLFRWQLNVLTLGEEEALSLGVDVKRVRNIILIVATFMTASCVAVCGVIGWVGLIIPHFVRRKFGSDHRYLLSHSIIYGATFLVAVDFVARTIATTEIPIGILTSFIGAPLFFYMMAKGEQRV